MIPLPVLPNGVHVEVIIVTVHKQQNLRTPLMPFELFAYGEKLKLCWNIGTVTVNHVNMQYAYKYMYVYRYYVQ